MYPAILGFGPTEMLLVGVLFFVLFGADKLPQAARQLGRAQAEFNKARKTFMAEMKSAEDQAFDRQVEFEQKREAQMKAQRYGELENLRTAASALGIATEGKSAHELRHEIADATTDATTDGTTG